MLLSFVRAVLKQDKRLSSTKPAVSKPEPEDSEGAYVLRRAKAAAWLPSAPALS